MFGMIGMFRSYSVLLFAIIAFFYMYPATVASYYHWVEVRKCGGQQQVEAEMA